MHKNIVLASQSPRRKQLLESIRVPFTVDPATEFNEIPKNKCTPQELVEMNAKGKAREVAARHKNSIIIGVDTVGGYKGEILEKPKDLADAFRMIQLYQGDTHQIYSGICIIDSASGREEYALEEAAVVFEPLTDEEIHKYLKQCEVMDKAAAYAIQGFASLFISEIRGSYYTIVGLPMHRLFNMLKSFDINLLDVVE
jgi:septum formation protein